MVATKEHKKRYTKIRTSRTRRLAKRVLFALTLVLVGFITAALWHGIDGVRLTGR